MSTDPYAAALGHFDAEPSPQAAPAPAADLTEMAAAIARLEALILGSAGQREDGSAALERIADIAFVLHEREVEASLCDALDAAVREISNSSPVHQVSTQRAAEAAELLRDLSRRVNAMIAAAEANPDPPLPPAAEAEPVLSAAGPELAHRGEDDVADTDELSAAAGLFDANMPEDDAFAMAVAALAAALPPHDEEAQLAVSAGEPATVSSTVHNDAQEPNVTAAAPEPAPGADDADGAGEEAEPQSFPTAADTLPAVETSIDAGAAPAAASLAQALEAEQSLGQEPVQEALPQEPFQESSGQESSGQESSGQESSGQESSDQKSSNQETSIQQQSAGEESFDTEKPDIHAAEAVEPAIAQSTSTDEAASDLSAARGIEQSDVAASLEPVVDQPSADHIHAGLDIPAVEPISGEVPTAEARPISSADEVTAATEPDAIAPAPFCETVEPPVLGMPDVEVAQGLTGPIEHEPVDRTPVEPIEALPPGSNETDEPPAEHAQHHSEGAFQLPAAAAADPVSAAWEIEIQAVDLVSAHGEEANASREIPTFAPPPPSTPSESALDPDEDPGDLFEPAEDVCAAGALAIAVAAPEPANVALDLASAAAADRMTEPAGTALPPLSALQPEKIGEASAPESIAAVQTTLVSTEPELEEPVPQSSLPPRPGFGEPAAAAPRGQANDPLAAVRALSEEETIALFS